MSDADIQRVREMFDAVLRDGVEGLIPHIHEDFAGEVPPEMSIEPDTYRGHDGIRRYFAGFDVVDDLRFEIDDIEDVGDGIVIAVGRVAGRGSATDLPFALDANMVIEFRDGLALRIDGHPDLDTARAAAAVLRAR